MEKMVKRSASKISQSLGYDAEKEAVVAYGLFAIVQVSLTIVLALLFGFLVGAPVQAMIVCFSVSIYRKYSGGAHADDAEFCTVVSVVYCTLAAWLSRLLAPSVTPVPLLLATLAVFAAVYWITYRYVPVDSPNKPITSPAKIRRMRTGSFVVITIYLALQLYFLFAGRQNPTLHSYAVSLLLGVGWQAFTLTPTGSILLHKLNVLPKFLRKEVSK